MKLQLESFSVVGKGKVLDLFSAYYFLCQSIGRCIFECGELESL